MSCTSETLTLEDISLRLNDSLLVGPISFSIAPGETLTLMGPSGCGKSSLLSFLCGTLSSAFQASGIIRIGNNTLNHLPAELRRLGILFQDDLLFPHLTVGENLAFGIPASCRSRNERRKRVTLALEQAGLEGFEDRDPMTLSGGQRARAALLRVLLSQPAALLLDEPFSSLDAGTRNEFRSFVRSHIQLRSLPTIMVTHDPEDAHALGGRIIPIGPHPG